MWEKIVRRAVVAVVLVALAAAVAESDVSPEGSSPPRGEVLVLGTYHMSNPGKDVHNVLVDDVLSPRRQGEVVELIEVLKAFRPTKIAVEASPGGPLAARYASYLAGQYELSRNEVDQIGLRLAKELDHEAVYAVDADGEFPYLRLAKYMKATGRESEFERLSARQAAAAEEEGEYFASHSILENLLYMNSDEQCSAGVAGYFQFAEWGERWDWAGADLVADWFRRNMRIYTNIANLVTSPNERVLVIYGSGHLGWLRFAFESSPNLRLRRLAEFAG